MTLQWGLNEGSIITIQLEYMVLKSKHRLTFQFCITVSGSISPLDCTLFFRNYFLHNILKNICSDNFYWLFTKVTHSDGTLKLLEDSQISTGDTLEPLVVENAPCDMTHRLRISIARYNKSTPVYFFIYGIRENFDSEQLATAVLNMCQTEIQFGNIAVRLAGFTNSSQISDNQFVISANCRKELLPKNQQYNKNI